MQLNDPTNQNAEPSCAQIMTRSDQLDESYGKMERLSFEDPAWNAIQVHIRRGGGGGSCTEVPSKMCWAQNVLGKVVDARGDHAEARCGIRFYAVVRRAHESLLCAAHA